ncbi:YtoQ family protein [Aestuariirhabdus litorea]|uniref:YtoQ family protein n=1 Tax=Aestuariirhabdus litorea TaxID=2528527 RepID=A0A3P3VLJ2_9GAMM|nr:YtoQ family protein [Aestuariirhabdus litorea]RRJ82586.1 YtoQ family protein [Aestuariirhabdus litorea]RWW92745.1 YtoQ family protein [Endozoicomonadaceae bacterium GTF-13]
MEYIVYLSGEIHTDWREQIREGVAEANLPITFYSPVTHHESSDEVGVEILGEEDKPFWKDHKSSKINAIRTNSMLQQADIVVVRFGDKYKQWNAAFDAGQAVAMGKQLIVMHAPELTHPLKEVDAQAMAVTETPQQVVEILKYISQP